VITNDDDDDDNNNNNNNNDSGLNKHVLCIIPAMYLISMLSSLREGALCNYQRFRHLDLVMV
jgi:hypothetical protein